MYEQTNLSSLFQNAKLIWHFYCWYVSDIKMSGLLFSQIKRVFLEKLLQSETDETTMTEYFEYISGKDMGK